MMMTKIEEWFLSLETLPWRDDSDPYSVIVLEIISQQTTLAVMLQRFPRFMQTFPNIKILAEASEEEILLAWEGLGYYRRALNLHKLAKHVVTNGYPSLNLKDWMKLPGVGTYTAAAILSRAYNLPVLAVDVNVERIITRYFNTFPLTNNLQGDFQKKFQEELEHNSRYFNQALIRIGQLLCKKKEKICKECPLSPTCQSSHLPLSTYSEKKKKEIVEKESYLLLIYHSHKFLLEKNSNGIGKNLYRIPSVSAEKWERLRKEHPSFLLKPRVHLYTHHRDKLIPLLLYSDNIFSNNHYVWLSKEEIQSKPFMTSYRLVINEAIEESRNLEFLLGLS